MSLSDAHETFLCVERGIRRETAETFGLHSNGDELVLPHRTGEKTRYWKEDGTRGFKFTKDRKPYLYGRDFTDKDTVFLVEGETDTMRLYQELQDDGSDAALAAGVAGIPGIETWKDTWAREFDSVSKVYVILDNDEDYMVRGKVEALWNKLDEDLRGKAVRVRLPSDVKDVCEFFKNYEMEALRDIASEAINGRYHYKALDMTEPPKPYNWLIKGFLCANDTVLWMGPPGVGKSLSVLDLCVHVMRGDKKWLGMDLLRSGRVLYVDEENPDDVVHHRLHGLGAKDELENLRYLHDQGIRLDLGHPSKLLDEIKMWQPEIIVIDSLKRFHRKDENNASEMSAVFEDGIKPLKKVCGSTVIVLHHTTKGDSNDSLTKARGSGDITAAPDSGVEVRKTNDRGERCLKHFKGRRSGYNEPVYFHIEGDEDDDVGRIELKEGRDF